MNGMKGDEMVDRNDEAIGYLIQLVEALRAEGADVPDPSEEFSDSPSGYLYNTLLDIVKFLGADAKRAAGVS